VNLDPSTGSTAVTGDCSLPHMVGGLQTESLQTEDLCHASQASRE
jgi:hypothetical protein